MIMSKNIDIFNILSGGERVTLECKKATKGVPASLWETYSAFANTYGGIILLGVVEHMEEMESHKKNGTKPMDARELLRRLREEEA